MDLIGQVETPSEEGFLAYVAFLNDSRFDGFSEFRLAAHHPGGAAVSFLADQDTLTDARRPILAVSLARPLPGRSEPERSSFRVAPAAMWAVENNLNLANMDWWDFTEAAASSDGVFTGF